MIVEDEAALAELLVSYFERDGFNVSSTADGLRAVDLAREVDPDVDVLDLGLPGPDGVEVCRQLRTSSDVYLVMVTARSDEVDTRITLSVGADGYLTKPFSPCVLMARVQAMLRRPRPVGHQESDIAYTDSLGPLSIDRTGRDVWLGSRRH